MKFAAVEARLGAQITDLAAKVDAMNRRLDRFRDSLNRWIDEVASNKGKIAATDAYLKDLLHRIERLELEVNTLKARPLGNTAAS
ncbi:MAG TPA: hypothetical protein VD969_21310 [Symbiobacteriaceae bacterium]|nr:hypothetical protein [Symbiobacteriaceae bacterium]